MVAMLIIYVIANCTNVSKTNITKTIDSNTAQSNFVFSATVHCNFINQLVLVISNNENATLN